MEVWIYNLPKTSAMYSMGQSALALCSLHPFSSRIAPLNVVYHMVRCRVPLLLKLYV